MCPLRRVCRGHGQCWLEPMGIGLAMNPAHIRRYGRLDLVRLPSGVYTVSRTITAEPLESSKHENWSSEGKLRHPEVAAVKPRSNMPSRTHRPSRA